MKNSLLLIGAFATLAVSCQKEPAMENVPVKGIEKTFVVSSPGTRTTLDGMNVKWAEGDEINVIAATTGNQYTFTLSDGAGTSLATFSGTLEETDAAETTFYAVYPNVAIRPASLLDGGLIEVDKTLGDTQRAVKDGFDPQFAVMTAIAGEDGKFTFRHGVAYFKITIGNENVSSVNLKTSNTRFQGRPVYVASTGNYSKIEGAQDNITLAPEEGTLEYGATYYIPVLCKNSQLQTLTLTYKFNDGTADKKMSTDAKAKVNLELGKVYNLGTPTFSVAPEISAKDVVIEADATSGTIEYSIVNPIEGEDVAVSLAEDVDWIFDLTAADGAVAFNCAANTEVEPRTAVITLSYKDAEDVEVTVRQKASGVSESHMHVLYYDSSSSLVNYTDGETGSYFTATAKADLGGDYHISEWTIGNYTSTKGVKMNSDGKITFTTSSTLTSTLQFYFIRRKTGDSSAKIQLVPASGDPLNFDTPYESYADSGVLTLEKGMSYTIQRKDKEQAVLLVIVNENE